MRKYVLLSILWASLVQLCAFQGLPSRVNMNTWGFGPWVQSSVGSPLPTPQTFRSTAEQLVVDPNNFVFNYAANTQCEVVVKGIERYRERIFNPARWPRKPAEINIQQHPKDTSKVAQQQAVKVLQNLEIIISGSVCDTQPKFGDDEQCHTQSWGPGQPGLLTACSQAKLTSAARPFLPYGPIDPSKDANYEFLRRLFDEITRVFPDEFLHLGGDEQRHSGSLLEAHYIHRLIDIINSLEKKKKPIVWQEVFDNGVPLSNDTVVHIWIGDNWQDEMAKVTRANKKVILSAGWYLNYISYGLDWEKYYLQDPEGF
ncbi:unnamed protein product, partial [Notodromas monacha]